MELTKVPTEKNVDFKKVVGRSGFFRAIKWTVIYVTIMGSFFLLTVYKDSPWVMENLVFLKDIGASFIIVLIIMLFGLIISPVFPFMLIGELFSLPSYFRAKKLVKQGLISPDWGTVGEFGGVFMLDERGRKIYAGKQLFSFDDIRQIGLNGKNRMYFDLKSGDNPRVYYSGRFMKSIETDYVIIRNALGW